MHHPAAAARHTPPYSGRFESVRIAVTPSRQKLREPTATVSALSSSINQRRFSENECKPLRSFAAIEPARWQPAGKFGRIRKLFCPRVFEKALIWGALGTIHLHRSVKRPTSFQCSGLRGRNERLSRVKPLFQMDTSNYLRSCRSAGTRGRVCM